VFKSGPVDSNDISLLIGGAERDADVNPRLYLARVCVLSALGYAPAALFGLGALICLAVLLISLISGNGVPALAVILALICAGAAVFIARSLMTSNDAPLAREITPDDAPALFAALDDVLQRMAHTKNGRTEYALVHSVSIDGSFDTKLYQVARRGVFGGFENHLHLGVPLLAALSIAELKAVLAHEIGHFGGEQERFAAWVYRQRAVWRALQTRFENPSTLGEQALAKFFLWYAAYFRAYSFVVARNLEYSADRAAAKATHPGAVANALTKLALMRRFLDQDFWPRLMSQVEAAPEPPYLPYSMMPRAFGMGLKQWSRQEWLEKCLRIMPAEGDTHPSLGDRFAALNIEPAPPTYSADRSSLSLFGTQSAAILKWCDQAWLKENGIAWRQRHKAIGELKWKISEYERTPASELPAEDLWQKILLLLDLGDDASATEELRMLVTREPSMAKAQLMLGKLLLRAGDEQGLKNLQAAAKHDTNIIEEAAGAGYTYLVDRGRKSEAQRFWTRVCAA
jgi:Peptidase family M48